MPKIVPRLPCGLPLITAEGAAEDARRLARRKEERRRVKEAMSAAERDTHAETSRRTSAQGGEKSKGWHGMVGGRAGGELLIEASSHRLLLACSKEREGVSLQQSSMSLRCVRVRVRVRACVCVRVCALVYLCGSSCTHLQHVRAYGVLHVDALTLAATNTLLPHSCVTLGSSAYRTSEAAGSRAGMLVLRH